MIFSQSMKSFLPRIAEKIVKDCLKIKENDSVLIVSGLHNIDFAEEIAINCYKIGATPLISATSDNYSKRVYSEIPEKHLEKVHKHLLGLFNELDVRIAIEPFEDPFLLKEVRESKIGAKRKASEPIWNKIVERGIKWLYLGYPTRRMAEAYGMPYEDLKKMYVKMLDINYSWLEKTCEKVKNYLIGKKKVRITHSNGTNLVFSIENRRINVDDGSISEENLREGDTGLNLPSGEVFVAPLEDSAEGKIIFNCPNYYQGKEIKNLELTFENGRIIKVSAEKGKEVFEQALANAHGDKEFIAEWGIGLNPFAKPIGYTLTDEKIIKSIHIAIGENRGYGGKNKSTIHWDLVLLNPTVYVDDELFMKDGKILCAEIEYEKD